MTAAAAGADATILPRHRARVGVAGGQLGTAVEMALVVVTIAAVAGLGRLFTDARFLGPVVGAAVGGHVIAAAARRLGVPLWLFVVLAAAGGFVVLAWVIEPATTTYGIPWGHSLHALGDDLSRAWRQFGDAAAPAVATRAFIASCALAGYVTAIIADTAAFRIGATFEAVIPAGTLFVFGAALGADRHRVAFSALFLLAVLPFFLLRSADRRAASSTWFVGRAAGGPSALVRGGAGLGALALALAVLFGPLLPGARGRPILSWRGNSGSGPAARVTVSPLVTIKKQLVEQSTVEVFTVKADRAAYWRLTSLERFDGEIWSSQGTYRPAKGDLPIADGPGAGTKLTVKQTFGISALSSIWLPVAYRPTQYSGPSGVRYDRNSGSLLTEADTSAGLTYATTSALADLNAAELSGAVGPVPADVTSTYLDLPGGFPGRITTLARSITAGASTPYAKAKALQDWFRGNFTYDESVGPGHDDNALLRFLFLDRRGYCEQFAGSYAAMARAIGLPARVAVGFREGSPDANGTYHVLGRDAHAWPEVFLSGYGWVAFEPTPTRSIPGASSYTGVSPAPASAGGSTTASTAPAAGSSTATTKPSDAKAKDANGDVKLGTGAASHARRSGRPVVVILLGVLTAAILTVAASPAGRWLSRRRRRAAAATPADRVVVAWDDATEWLGLAGHARQRWETPYEYARRPDVHRVASGVSVLADTLTLASWSVDGVEDDAARAAESTSADVKAAVLATTPRRQRVRWALDPRPRARG
jgi:transglutaminase-like putative cysteine protease